MSLGTIGITGGSTHGVGDTLNYLKSGDGVIGGAGNIITISWAGFTDYNVMGSLNVGNDPGKLVNVGNMKTVADSHKGYTAFMRSATQSQF